MDAGPRFDSYAWAGGREPMLRFGPTGGPVVVLALPLFEEANRTRAFGVAILRALAAKGVGGLLPELPGQGESERVTAALTLADARAAFAAAAAGAWPAAIRSGALLVDARAWLLAPQSGPALLREMARIKGKPLTGEPVEVAGNLLSPPLYQHIATAAFHAGAGRGPGVVSPEQQDLERTASQLGPGLRRGGRVVRLAGDAEPADRHVDAAPLWRRAEPGNDLPLAALLADDIAAWIATCES